MLERLIPSDDKIVEITRKMMPRLMPLLAPIYMEYLEMSPTMEYKDGVLFLTMELKNKQTGEVMMSETCTVALG